MPELEDEPFPRAVTLRLAQALDFATRAISAAVDTDRFDAFEAAVEDGVNANLCEALAQLTENGGGIDVTMSWARIRPSPLPSREYQFSREMGRVLQSAAQEYRRNEPELEKTVVGFVIHLDRAPEQETGIATLRVLIDGRPKRLRARFEAGEYRQVIRAHDEKLPVSLEGDIYTSGQRLELRNPRNLRLLTDSLDANDQLMEQ